MSSELAPCVGCGHAISTRAETCPHCHELANKRCRICGGSVRRADSHWHDFNYFHRACLIEGFSPPTDICCPTCGTPVALARASLLDERSDRACPSCGHPHVLQDSPWACRLCGHRVFLAFQKTVPVSSLNSDYSIDSHAFCVGGARAANAAAEHTLATAARAAGTRGAGRAKAWGYFYFGYLFPILVFFTVARIAQSEIKGAVFLFVPFLNLLVLLMALFSGGKDVPIELGWAIALAWAGVGAAVYLWLRGRVR